MEKFFSNLTPKEAQLLRGFIIKWKKFFSKVEIIKSLWDNVNLAEYYIKTLKKKWQLISLQKWIYTYNDGDTTIKNILTFFCGDDYYLWGTMVANSFNWIEQVATSFLVYNKKYSWIKNIGNYRIQFIKKSNLSQSEFVKNSTMKFGLNFPIKEQAFVDFINNPSAIWWDYELLYPLLKQNLVDKSKILNLLIKENNKSSIIRFLFMLKLINQEMPTNFVEKFLPASYIFFNVNGRNSWRFDPFYKVKY